MFLFIYIRKKNKNMDYKERFFINNYSFFGESTRRRCKYKQKEAQAIKDKYKKKGVYFLPVKKFEEAEAPVKYVKKDNDAMFSAVQFAVASLEPQDQDKILELAKNMPSSEVLINSALAIQEYRIKLGLKNEYEQGRILDSTETAMSNLVNMIQAKYNIEEDQDINVNVNNSITAILDEIDEEEKDYDDEINIDIDKENRKEEIKKIHNQSINDYL